MADEQRTITQLDRIESVIGETPSMALLDGIQLAAVTPAATGTYKVSGSTLLGTKLKTIREINNASGVKALVLNADTPQAYSFVNLVTSTTDKTISANFAQSGSTDGGTVKGISGYNSAEFNVTANGYVTLKNSGISHGSISGSTTDNGTVLNTNHKSHDAITITAGNGLSIPIGGNPHNISSSFTIQANWLGLQDLTATDGFAIPFYNNVLQKMRWAILPEVNSFRIDTSSSQIVINAIPGNDSITHSMLKSGTDAPVDDTNIVGNTITFGKLQLSASNTYGALITSLSTGSVTVTPSAQANTILARDGADNLGFKTITGAYIDENSINGNRLISGTLPLSILPKNSSAKSAVLGYAPTYVGTALNVDKIEADKDTVLLASSTTGSLLFAKIGTPNIKDYAVESLQIKNGAVDNNKLAANSVTNLKILANTIAFDRITKTTTVGVLGNYTSGDNALGMINAANKNNLPLVVNSAGTGVGYVQLGGLGIANGAIGDSHITGPITTSKLSVTTGCYILGKNKNAATTIAPIIPQTNGGILRVINDEIAFGSISGTSITNDTAPLSVLDYQTGSGIIGHKAVAGNAASAMLYIQPTGSEQLLMTNSSGSLGFAAFYADLIPNGSISNTYLQAGAALANINSGVTTKVISGSYLKDNTVLGSALATGAALTNIGTGGLTYTYLGSNAAVYNINGNTNTTTINGAKITANTVSSLATSTAINNIGDGTLTHTKIAGISAPNAADQIVMYDTSALGLRYMTVAGGLSISAANQMTVNHDATTGGGGTRHTDHATISVTGAGIGLSGGGAITANQVITLTSYITPSANKIPQTNADGYLNRLVQDCVYIQLFPFSESIVTVAYKTLVWIPSYFTGKVLKTIGMGVGNAASGTVTVTVSTGEIVGSVSVTGISQYSNENNAPAIITLPGRYAISVTTSGTVGKGLDCWLIFG